MFVIGTAGHIDHGKTTLVKALTGMETDRLKEEKERGITTELGFAHLDLGDGLLASIVDAPGHERFVRHMIAGAGGLDLALLVVAADEGVMPQTREHLDILGLVGVRRGLVVLTKCDLVDDDGLELAEDDVLEGLRGTFLEGADVLRFSASRPQEHPAFREDLVARLRAFFPGPPHRPVDRPLRIAIDRVFVMKGFGTVVTGTCTAGRLSVGDAIEVLPGGPTSTVRGLQSHGRPVESIQAGDRAAVNLQGIERTQVERGQVLSTPGAMATSTLLDARLTLLSRVRRPLARRTYAVVHVGTTQVDGTVFLLDRDELNPGQSCPCQLRLTRPVSALAGDPFILRGFETLAGYGKTVGGGLILHPAPVPRKARDRTSLELLGQLEVGQEARQVLSAVELAGNAGLSQRGLLAVSLTGRCALNSALGGLIARKEILTFKRESVTRYLGTGVAEALGARCLKALSSSHQRWPDRDSFTVEEIGGTLPDHPDPAVLAAVLNHLVDNERLLQSDGRFSLPGHVSSLDSVSTALLDEVHALFEAAGLSTPTVDQAATELGMDSGETGRAVDALVRQGRMIRLGSSNLVFAREVMDATREKLVTRLSSVENMTTGEIKKLFGVSRKFAIPLAEYFDSQHVTLRLPDGTRKLRSP